MTDPFRQEYQQVPHDPRPVMVVASTYRDAHRMLRDEGLRPGDRGVVVINLAGRWQAALAGRSLEDYRIIGASLEEVQTLQRYPAQFIGERTVRRARRRR